jgi:hypothetical protein
MRVELWSSFGRILRCCGACPCNLELTYQNSVLVFETTIGDLISIIGITAGNFFLKKINSILEVGQHLYWQLLNWTEVLHLTGVLVVTHCPSTSPLSSLPVFLSQKTVYFPINFLVSQP